MQYQKRNLRGCKKENQVKISLTNWKNICHFNHKGSIFLIYKGLTEIEKNGNTSKKCTKNMNIKFLGMKIYKAYSHLKIRSNMLTIREMKVKIVIRYHFLPSRLTT